MTLTVYSYNSRGFDISKQDICKVLMTESENNLSILCNQENFLLKGNCFIVKQCLPKFHIFFKPAVKEGLTGRSKNGLFVAIPNMLMKFATDVSPVSHRIQAISIKLGGKTILLINAYFPTDAQKSGDDMTDLLTTLLAVQ